MNSLLKLSLLVLCFGCTSEPTKESNQASPLPYFDEATFTPKWFDSENQLPDDFHQIPDFSLKNQLGQTVSQQEVEGKILVVDFFFTSCPGICPKLTGNMYLVQQTYLEDDEILLMSHSVTPEHDSVSVLKHYAEAHGVVSGKWHLLTGDRKSIYDLGRNQYFVEEDLGLEKNPDDFIHTENFVLIDGSRRIRGIYNGLNKASVNQMILDINTLKRSS